MISDVVSIYFPLVSHISQQISPHYHGFHHFFRLNMSFMLALAFIHFFLPVSRNNFQGNSLFNNAFRGLDLSSYPLGMVLWQLFSYVSIFPIIHFTLKQPSRMYNPQRKLPTSVQNRFTQISSLYHWFQSIVRTNSTFRHWLQPIIRLISLFPSLDASNFSNLLLPNISKSYHGLSSVVQSISLVFNILPQSF